MDSEDCLLASDEGPRSEKARLFRNCSESDVLSLSNFNDYGNEQGSNVFKWIGDSVVILQLVMFKL